MGDRQATPGSARPRVSRLALASLILGVLGLLGSVVLVGGLLAIPAIICGHMALARVRPAAGVLRGRRLALAGLLIGYTSVVVTVAWIPVAREQACRVNCAGNLKHIGNAVWIYSADNGGRSPNDLSMLVRLEWLSAMNVYTCPSTDTPEAPTLEEFYHGGHCDYLYFGKGLTEACNGHDPKATILGCDKPGNHRKFVNVVFADRHVKGYRCKGDIADLARREKLYLPEE